MKKIISLSIFKNNKNNYRPCYYWRHIKSSVWGYLLLFPDWKIKIYHDASIYSNHYGGVLLRLAEKGLIELEYISEESALCKAMLWRLLPLFDNSVSYVLCRDIDHSPTIREKKMVDCFIASGRTLHSIQDNPAHTVPMLGGLIGFDAKKFREVFPQKSLESLLQHYNWTDKLEEHGSDQDFLSRCIWKQLSKNCGYHSIRGIIHGAAQKFDDVPKEHTIDNCTPFMGTAKCDFDVWYSELNKLGDLSTISTLKSLERETFTNDKSTNNNLELSSINIKRVILSMDSNNNYYFFLPIVAKLWQKYMGYCPVCNVVGTPKQWLTNNNMKLSINEARKIGTEIHFIDEFSPYPSSFIAQNSRFYISCLNLYSDEMYLILSDIDMLPLSKLFFNQQDESKNLHLYYANVYNHEQYPCCYIGAKVKTWREIVKPSCIDNMKQSMLDQFQFDKILEETDGLKRWCYDEKMLGLKIRNWSGYPHSCHMINRKGCPPIDRIDRSCWPEKIDIIGKVDCHSVRPGHTSPNWEKIESVLFQIFDAKDMEWVRNYRWNFCLGNK